MDHEEGAFSAAASRHPQVPWSYLWRSGGTALAPLVAPRDQAFGIKLSEQNRQAYLLMISALEHYGLGSPASPLPLVRSVVG